MIRFLPMVSLILHRPNVIHLPHVYQHEAEWERFTVEDVNSTEWSQILHGPFNTKSPRSFGYRHKGTLIIQQELSPLKFEKIC
jgi:hypothetical protein